MTRFHFKITQFLAQFFAEHFIKKSPTTYAYIATSSSTRPTDRPPGATTLPDTKWPQTHRLIPFGEESRGGGTSSDVKTESHVKWCDCDAICGDTFTIYVPALKAQVTNKRRKLANTDTKPHRLQSASIINLIYQEKHWWRWANSQLQVSSKNSNIHCPECTCLVASHRR